MPFTVSEIIATQDRTVGIVHIEGGGFRAVTEGEEPLISLAYRLGSITPRWEAEAAARQESAAKDDTTWIVPLLVVLVSSWDVQTDDGKPYPLTEDALSELPYALLFGIWGCIIGDAEVPKASTSVSSDGSAHTTAVKVRSAKNRTGTTRSSGPSVRRAS